MNRMKTADLNADLGEGAGDDEALLAIVSSANIACGFHAGDPHAMHRAAEACVRRGTAIGAHPGLPDRIGFGRREMDVTAEEVEDYVLYQTGALQAIAKAAGGRVAHVKPHGALYHMASRSRELADAIVRAAAAVDPGLAIFGPPGSELLRAAEAAGLPTAAEGFADRAYLADGRLAPRRLPGAVLGDAAQALEQAVGLLERGSVAALDGGTAAVSARTICLHGDTPGAAAFALALRHGLEERGYRIEPFGVV